MDNLKFYIVNVGGYVSIIDYATYEIIKMYDINKQPEEAKKYLTYLSKLNNYSYVNLILKLSNQKSTLNLFKERVKDREEWIQGAWMQVTNKTLKELKLSINIHYNKPFNEVLGEYEKVHKAISQKSPNKLSNSTTHRKLPKKVKKRFERQINTIESKSIKTNVKKLSVKKKVKL